MVAEAYKAHVHAGLVPQLYHLRETRGAKVDLVVERGVERLLVEVRSGATVASDALGGVRAALADGVGTKARLVYGGHDAGVRSGVELWPWAALNDAAWVG